VKRLVLVSLLGGLLATSAGCGLMQSIFCYRPCVMRGDCLVEDGCYEDGCGPALGRPVRGPVFAARRARVYAEGDMGCDVVGGRPCRRPLCSRCGPVCDPCCDPCGDVCYGRCWHRGPLSCIFALFMRGCWWDGGCQGCGERYWGDFYSDPPDCWDPCDGYGNYTGGGCRDCGTGGEMDYSYSRPRGSIDQDGYAAQGQVVSDRVVRSAPRSSVQQQPRRAVRPQTNGY